MEYNSFPHKNELLKPACSFLINGKWLFMYFHMSMNPGTPYNLYWEDEKTPIQSGLGIVEALKVVISLLA